MGLLLKRIRAVIFASGILLAVSACSALPSWEVSEPDLSQSQLMPESAALMVLTDFFETADQRGIRMRDCQGTWRQMRFAEINRIVHWSPNIGRRAGVFLQANWDNWFSSSCLSVSSFKSGKFYSSQILELANALQVMGANIEEIHTTNRL